MRALVTMAVGDDYRARFERYCRPNWTAYARRHGYDLVVFDSPLDDSRRARGRPLYWQKNCILEQEVLSKYEQVAWIDSDIVINADVAPPIFEGVPADRIGAVDEYRVPDAATYRKALAATYLRAKRLGQPFLHNLSPQEYYRQRGLPEFGEVVQGGLIVCSPHHHREVFQAVYSHEDPGVPAGNYEMGALSYEILRRNLVTWLDYRFNRLVLLGIAENLPAVPDRHSDQRPAAETASVGSIIAKLYAGCYFLHFAGCQPLMEHLAQLGR